eukprot:gnl/Ergobibamus_cyprinoides/4340.p2 GENE.gnl/Ergobibamus_cyprinoides/4340~~gnl/Ergobibamus_cyprinoides/4340.p2  ORF type:complete len:109 (-),score=8.38 gnl/Ergobibamus_cyprinoides/4340:17-343(-)
MCRLGNGCVAPAASGDLQSADKRVGSYEVVEQPDRDHEKKADAAKGGRKESADHNEGENGGSALDGGQVAEEGIEELAAAGRRQCPCGEGRWIQTRGGLRAKKTVCER